MKIFDYINHINYNIVRKKLFRREVEASYYSQKNIKLPAYDKIKGDELQQIKETFPFTFFSSDEEKVRLKNTLELIEDTAEVIKKAGAVLRNEYLLPGKQLLSPGENIKWNYDYAAKYEWEKSLSWMLDFTDAPVGVDIKNTWYIARFHQGIILSRAYFLTGNEKYTSHFLNLFKDFISSNRFCTGVNWIKTSEVSIRLINVLFSFGFFINSSLVDENIYNTLFDFVLHHTLFIENNLEYAGKRGSSYLVNLLALTAAGIFLKRSYYGKKNIEFAYSGFEQEMREQVHEDGVSYEQSVPLHSVLLEVFYLGKTLLTREGFSFTELYNEKLKLMFEVQSAYLRDDNSVPQIGDAIVGRILPINILNEQPDYSSVMAAGAYLFKEPKFKDAEKEVTPEVVLMFGVNAADEYKSIRIEKNNSSSGFVKGGHYILKDDNLHLFIEAGEIGKRGLGAPGHNDTFSFELFYMDENIIVDPGTYSIYADNELRNKFRSVKNHNTAYVDDEELSELEGLFKIKDDITKPKLIEWRSNKEEDFLSIQHYGYARFTDPVIVKRNFHYHKAQKIIEIRDEFIGGDVHKVVAGFLFHPNIKLISIGENTYTASGRHSNIKLQIKGSSVSLKSSVTTSLFSEGYGKIEETKRITIMFKEKLPAYVTTQISLE